MGGDQVQSSNLPADSANESVHSKDKGEESSPATTTGGKSKGKGTKETSESQKEDYIHVRARRGQATNSHSLAERVRIPSPSGVPVFTVQTLVCNFGCYMAGSANSGYCISSAVEKGED